MLQDDTKNQNKTNFAPIKDGAEFEYSYGLCSSPFGLCCGVSYVDRDGMDNVAFLGFPTNQAASDETIEHIKSKWHPKAMHLDVNHITHLMGRAFSGDGVNITLFGTPFQHRVWEALLDISSGTVCSYGALADKLKSAPRAVGGAVGANPVSYFIPCHRVLGSDKALHGYRWGLDVKQKILEFEGASIDDVNTKM